MVPYTKTKAGGREVDLCSEVIGLVRLYVMDRKGLLFPTRKGTPRLYGNVERRQLWSHTPKGFHAFRRFRNTHLRYMNCQPDILIFWMGHKPETMSELYSKLALMKKERFAEAERVGLGFKKVQSERERRAEAEEMAESN